jgi:hypothetical protein
MLMKKALFRGPSRIPRLVRMKVSPDDIKPVVF